MESVASRSRRAELNLACSRCPVSPHLFQLNQTLPFYPGGGSGAILTLSQNPCTNKSAANYSLCCRRVSAWPFLCPCGLYVKC